MLRKNFAYGDFWSEIAPTRTEKDETGARRADPASLTTNKVFVDYLKTHGYSVFIDYDYDGLAKTTPAIREIRINGHYSDAMIESFLQHELGHLMLFNDAKFASVRQDTLASIVCRELYTAERIKKYGVQPLLTIENIIQDIVIETLSGTDCVCETSLIEYGTRMCVKHLDNLENLRIVAKETSKNLLAQTPEIMTMVAMQVEVDEITGKVKQREITVALNYDASIRPIIEAMIKDIEADVNEILKALVDAEQTNSYFLNAAHKTYRKLDKHKSHAQRIDTRAAKSKKGLSPKLRHTRKLLAENITALESKEQMEADKKEAEEKRAAAIARLERQLKFAEDLLRALKLELLRVPLEKEKENNGQENGEGMGRNAPKSNEGEENGDGNECENREEVRDENGGRMPMQQKEGGETPPTNAHAQEKVNITRNNTDHLQRDMDVEKLPSFSNYSKSHSYDCGLPHPITIERSETRALDERKILKSITSSIDRKTIRLDERDLQEIPGGTSKVPEYETSYFKSAKREWDASDMMKGKRKLHKTGVGVLVGLDVSGSMSEEWSMKFEQLSQLIKSLEEELGIDNIHFFTYDTAIREESPNFEDMVLTARGGNSFSYVYQDIMRNLPILHKNEIILVTDCGDNLGFKLEDVVAAERNNEKVINHISVVDTEYAAFYNQSQLHKEDWSLHRADDSDLFGKIKENIELLIER